MIDLEIIESEFRIINSFRSSSDASDCLAPKDDDVSNRVTIAPPRNRLLYLVKDDKRFNEETGVWERTEQGSLRTSDVTTTRNLGRMLLSCSGGGTVGALSNRIVTVLEREFDRPVESMKFLHWEKVIRSMEWIAAESAMFEDVVLILTELSELKAPAYLRSVLKLKAAEYRENRLGDLDGALALSLDAQALSPFSIKTVKTLCEKLHFFENQLHEKNAGTYWKRFITIYIDLITTRRDEKETQVSALLMLSRIFADGMEDPKAGLRCAKKAVALDPDNRDARDRLAALAKCN